APRETSAVASAAAVRGPQDEISDRADQGRIAGSPNAGVWVIAASDFQCPFCKRWHDETYPLILRDYVQTGKIRLAYLNYPISSHTYAVPSAEAAMCASAQGKFWQ